MVASSVCAAYVMHGCKISSIVCETHVRHGHIFIRTVCAPHISHGRAPCSPACSGSSQHSCQNFSGSSVCNIHLATFRIFSSQKFILQLLRVFSSQHSSWNFSQSYFCNARLRNSQGLRSGNRGTSQGLHSGHIRTSQDLDNILLLTSRCLHTICLGISVSSERSSWNFRSLQHSFRKFLGSLQCSSLNFSVSSRNLF